MGGPQHGGSICSLDTGGFAGKITPGGSIWYSSSKYPAHKTRITESSISVVLSAAFIVKQRGGAWVIDSIVSIFLCRKGETHLSIRQYGHALVSLPPLSLAFIFRY